MTSPHRAAVIETHAAIVFFVGDRAYKLKKPVDLGFLDFRRRVDREAVCHREVELNRRLAPDVYLGVADIEGPEGEPCDHLVVMRRMPTDRRLSTLVRSGAPVADDLRRLARDLAGFHSRACRGPAISAEGGRGALLGRWDATFAQLRPFHGDPLDPGAAAEVEERTHEFLAGREPLFAERVAGGHIVDGHGDLIADDIFCLPDGPRALDCLEFDDRLRYLTCWTTPRSWPWTSNTSAPHRWHRRSWPGTRSTAATRHRPRCGTTTSPTAPSSAPRSAACATHKATSPRRTTSARTPT